MGDTSYYFEICHKDALSQIKYINKKQLWDIFIPMVVVIFPIKLFSHSVSHLFAKAKMFLQARIDRKSFNLSMRYIKLKHIATIVSNIPKFVASLYTLQWVLLFQWWLVLWSDHAFINPETIRNIVYFKKILQSIVLVYKLYIYYLALRYCYRHIY